MMMMMMMMNCGFVLRTQVCGKSAEFFVVHVGGTYMGCPNKSARFTFVIKHAIYSKRK